MKFSKPSQLFLVSSLGLVVAMFLSACQLVTIDYLYLATAGTGTSDGQVQTFAVDSETGALRTGPAAVSSGGIDPVSLAISPNYQNVYVANAGDNTVVHFDANYNGQLIKQDSITLAGSPVALAVNQAGNALFVLSGSTSATLTEYALSSSGTIGSVTATQALSLPGFTGDPLVPTGLVSLADNKAVYATVYDQAAYNPGGTVSSTANPGWVFGFTVGSGGALTPTLGSPYKAGVKPSGLTADPTSRFVFVTDFASNQLIGYGIQSTGYLNFLINGPFKTGAEPSGVAIDPRGIYMYVSNALDSSVSAYVINLNTGTPSAAINPTGSAANVTDTQPVAIAVDPALGRFVYTANFLGNSISGFQLDPNAGTLIQSQATPYPADLHPTALALAPHGNHSIQSVTP